MTLAGITILCRQIWLFKSGSREGRMDATAPATGLRRLGMRYRISAVVIGLIRMDHLARVGDVRRASEPLPAQYSIRRR
jgi:hypothetical protein